MEWITKESFHSLQQQQQSCHEEVTATDDGIATTTPESLRHCGLFQQKVIWRRDFSLDKLWNNNNKHQGNSCGVLYRKARIQISSSSSSLPTPARTGEEPRKETRAQENEQGQQAVTTARDNNTQQKQDQKICMDQDDNIVWLTLRTSVKSLRLSPAAVAAATMATTWPTFALHLLLTS